MAGQNPPAHPNHLGEPINLTKFTGKRPTPFSINILLKLCITMEYLGQALLKKEQPLKREQSHIMLLKKQKKPKPFLKN
jgi:hypothetical protein